MEQKFHLKITSAVVIDGKIQKPETIVHLPSRVAVNLLERGKAMLATAEDMAAAAAQPEALVAEDVAPEAATEAEAAQAEAEAPAPAPAPAAPARKTARNAK